MSAWSSRRWLWLPLLLLASACGGAQKAAAPPAGQLETLRIAIIKDLGSAEPLVAEAKGFFARSGIKAEITQFKDGPTQLEAFIAGNSDIGLAGIGPAAIWRSKGAPLQVIAGSSEGGHVVYVRKDEGITSPQQLKGKQIGAPTAGSVSDILLRALVLKKIAGLDPAKDVKITGGIAYADLPVLLMVRKEVDAIMNLEPSGALGETQYPGQAVLLDLAQYWKSGHNGKSYPVIVMLAREDLLKQKPDLVKKALKVHKDTIDFVNREPDESNKILANKLSLTEPVIKLARTRVDFATAMDLAAAREILEFSAQLGYLKSIPSEDELYYKPLLETK